MAESIVRAPYNFVPFSGKKPFIRYASPAELPPHDRVLPELLSGEIRVTLRAETPVFVSDGEKDPHFFRGPDGKRMIPGSTVRGMLRENMQILGYGLMTPGEDLEDIQIFYRKFAAGRETVGGPLSELYKKKLDVQTRRSGKGKTYSIPTRVRSGYIFCENGQYLIRPTISPYLKISRSDPEVRKFGEGDARVVPVAYSATGERISRIVARRDAEVGMLPGYLLYTGKPVRNKNHLYLFPPTDITVSAEAVSKEDILSYKEDLKQRKNILTANYDLEFWALPEEGDSKPVFYAAVDGHLYFGMTLFLRLKYPHSLAEGLPDVYREFQTAGEQPLDYPHAILGFAESPPRQGSYRSRISVGDFPLVNAVSEQTPVQAILGEPKPSYYPGYIEQGKHYEEDFRLRGYKHYWLHEVIPTSVPEDKNDVVTTMRPLPVGSKFQGTIRFRNLAEDELGLLLWALRLQEGCFQTLGMGKPLGYGRMKLTIDALLETDWAALYGGELSAVSLRDRTEQAEEYIHAFDAYICGKLYIKKPSKDQPSITSQPEIQDFFFLKSNVRPVDEVRYMEPKGHWTVKNPLPTVTDIRKEEQENRTSTAGQAARRQAPTPEKGSRNEEGLDLEALRRKFGKL